jgi:hypothetical protein
LGVAAALVVGAAGAGGAEPRSGEPVGLAFRLSGDQATGNEGVPGVVYNPAADEYFVVWQDGRASQYPYPTTADIYGRRVSAQGLAVGREVWVTGPYRAYTRDLSPSVAYNSTRDNYLVVWYVGWNGSDGVWARRVSAKGTRVGDQVRVGDGVGMDPVVAYDPAADGYLVVWWDRPTGIWGRLLTGGGKGIGEAFAITGAGGIEPAVAYNPAAEEYLVVWTDQRDYDTRGLEVYGCRVSTTGAAIGDDFRISDSGGLATDEAEPAVVWNDLAGRYLVVWEDSRSRTEWDVYGRWVSAGGVPVRKDFRVGSLRGTGNEHTPAVSCNSITGLCLVVWQDYRDTERRSSDIWGRLVAADGTMVGRDFRVGGPGGMDAEFDPVAACNPAADQCLVVWSDLRRWETRGADIYGVLLAG